MDTKSQQATFDAWLRDHAAILHHVANGFATGADRHDLMQELMLALWHAIPAFRGAARPSTYIFRVTHNAALTWKRAERGYRRRLDSFQEQQHVEPARAIEAAGVEAGTDKLEQLYAAIRQLDPLDRSLVLLPIVVAALFDENRLSRLRLRMSLIASTLAMAGLPLVTFQLQLVGKQRPHEAASMLVVFGIGFAIAVGVQIWKYRRLRAEQARLQELLGSYEA